MKLPKRLEIILSLLPESGGVADIGTDHGLIPVYLAQLGRHKPIIATDVNEGPLLKAENNARRFAVADRISFRLGDGLAPLVPGEAACILIAGLGETTIARIVQTYQGIARSSQVLILQPMDGAARLRQLIWQLNWRITEEAVVEDRGKFYQTVRIAPAFSFVIPSVKLQESLELTQEEIIEFGPLLLARKDRDFAALVRERLSSRLEIRSQILARAEGRHQERLWVLNQEIDRLEKVMKWLDSGK